jgi:hypothetical protein
MSSREYHIFSIYHLNKFWFIKPAFILSRRQILYNQVNVIKERMSNTCLIKIHNDIKIISIIKTVKTHTYTSEHMSVIDLFYFPLGQNLEKNVFYSLL